MKSDELDARIHGLRDRLTQELRARVHIHAGKFAVDAMRWILRLGDVPLGEDGAGVKKSLVEALAAAAAGLDPEGLYDQSEARLGRALDGDFEGMLRLFSGKSTLARAAEAVDMKPTGYADLVIRVLAGEVKKEGADLRGELVQALAPYLPPRTG